MLFLCYMLFFSITASILCILSKKSLPICECFLLCFFQEILHFRVYSGISGPFHFCVLCEVRVKFFFFSFSTSIQLLLYHLLKDYLIPMNYFNMYVGNQLIICVCVCLVLGCLLFYLSTLYHIVMIL